MDKKEHAEEMSFSEKLKAVAMEIETKKMVPIAAVIKALEDHGEYCERCEAPEPTVFYNPKGNTSPTLCCPWCGESLKIDTIIKRARNLPHDYLERMIAKPAKDTFIEKIGEDTWIIDRCLAEVAGDIHYSYPDRNKFKPTNAISKIFDGLDLGKYEEAKISRTIYRSECDNHTLIAELKSANHTKYVNNDFTEHMRGIFTPYISSPLTPILIKDHEKVRRIVQPIRFDPADIDKRR